MADDIVARIRLPDIPPAEFDITDFGATPDDGRDDRPAILAAIAAASGSGGGRVILPAGHWDSAGPIVLRSHIELHVSEGATLLFSPHAADYLPVVRTRWEGTLMMGYSPLIYAADVEDVAVTGKGLIDGNANSEFLAWSGNSHDALPRLGDILRLRQMGEEAVPVGNRVFGEGTYLQPSAIEFLGARRVLLEDYTISNSPFWVNHLVFTQSATVRRVNVASHRANNDGVDVDSSSYVLIENNHFRAGDDSVAVKSGRDRDGRDIAIPSEYVVVRHNDTRGGDGIAIGSEMSGGVRFVFFDDNDLQRGKAAVRFKGSLDRGGVVEHIRVRNLAVGTFDTLFLFQLVRGDETDGRFPSTYRDIFFEDVRADRVGRFMVVDAPYAAPLCDVTMRSVSVGAAARTFDVENVERLNLDDVIVGGRHIDGTLSWRPAQGNDAEFAQWDGEIQ
ncbi:MAG: glycosyl hydrolase family 28 protein [Woeseiaceae bacterium]